MHPLIEQIAIIGDQRKYLVASSFLLPGADQWTKSKNINRPTRRNSSSIPSAEKFNETVDELNKPLGRVEQIKRFTLINRAFSQETASSPRLSREEEGRPGQFQQSHRDMYKE